MRHAGKARRAGLKLVGLSLLILILVLGAWSYLAGTLMSAVAIFAIAFWLVFLVFSLSFFRDPQPKVPPAVEAFVSPAHGTVDLIDETVEKVFMGGPCRRISIFLSIFDVHVQNSPVNGKITYVNHCPGKFLNAMRSDCGLHNENVLLGFESSDVPGERVAVRLIAGLLARRIVPWVVPGDVLHKGERTSLIQFGSRVDLYLPLQAKVQVALGQKVRGGETVVATRA